MRLWYGLAISSLIAASLLSAGCSSTAAAAAHSATKADKIAPALTSAARQLENGTRQPPLTGLVRSDDKGNIQVYVHVTDTSAEHLDALAQHGLQHMLASPALKIVQGWVQPQNLSALAALPFVTRITPPRYAIPR